MIHRLHAFRHYGAPQLAAVRERMQSGKPLSLTNGPPLGKLALGASSANADIGKNRIIAKIVFILHSGKSASG